MPLGPEVIQNRHLELLLEIIDKQIREATSIPVSIPLDYLPYIHEEIKRVKHVYVKAGWNDAKIVDDNVFGDNYAYLELS